MIGHDNVFWSFLNPVKDKLIKLKFTADFLIIVIIIIAFSRLVEKNSLIRLYFWTNLIILLKFRQTLYLLIIH